MQVDLVQILYFVAAIGAFIGGYQRGTAASKSAASATADATAQSPVTKLPGDDVLVAEQAREIHRLKEKLDEAEQQNHALYQINSLQRYLRSGSSSRTWQGIIEDSPFLLVVEDSGTDAELLRRAFVRARLANEIVVARDAQEAFDFLFGTGAHVGRNLSRQPELVLLDLKLPGPDGMEVLKRIRADPNTEHIPVVVLTGAGSEENMIASMELGIDGYLRKSAEFDFEQFIRLMTTIGMHLLILRAAWSTPARLESEDNHV